MSDVEFVIGLFVKPPRDGAPEFVKASISIKRLAFIAWLQAHEGEWINLDVKESRGGKWYAAVNAWKPERRDKAPATAAADGGNDPTDDIPF